MITTRYYIEEIPENNAVGLDAASSWLPSGDASETSSSLTTAGCTA
jgi:hypothetical protein